jgi:histidyl-tRNA synthetase
MKNQIPSVKGARDFYPEQMRVRSWLYRMMRKVSESYGYEEYDGPFLEYLELYAAKSGDELVKEQSFVFKDRGGEWITLRPELTPSLARMVAQNKTNSSTLFDGGHLARCGDMNDPKRAVAENFSSGISTW